MAKKKKDVDTTFGEDLNVDLMLPEAVDFEVENPIICTTLRSGKTLIDDDVRGYTIVDLGGKERTVWHSKALFALTMIPEGTVVEVKHTDTKKIGKGTREMKIFSIRKAL